MNLQRKNIQKRVIKIKCKTLGQEHLGKFKDELGDQCGRCRMYQGNKKRRQVQKDQGQITLSI